MILETPHTRLFTVCYFGTYSPGHTRNAVNIQGLRNQGVRVIECNTTRSGFGKYTDLLKKVFVLRGSFDVMIVGFNGHAIMPLAWVVTLLLRRKLVFDAFTSLYDSTILDRQAHSPYGVMAFKLWLIDWIACHLADLVLLDSDTHAQYISSTFHVPRRYVRALPVGCPDDVMYPRDYHQTASDFIVHFHGTYIPTQGIPFILEAARILKKKRIVFHIVGKRSAYEQTIRSIDQLGLRNVKFFDYMPYEQLATMMARADVCLGAFGDTGRARRTGAFKIIEGMAMRKPVVTGDSPALREFFSDRENILFCALANGRDLADKIEELYEHKELRDVIAQGGFALYRSRFTPEHIGKQLLDLIRTL